MKHGYSSLTLDLLFSIKYNLDFESIIKRTNFKPYQNPLRYEILTVQWLEYVCGLCPISSFFQSTIGWLLSFIMLREYAEM